MSDLDQIITDATDQIILKRDERMLIWSSANSIIKAACEKALDWKQRELEGLKSQNEGYRLDNLRLRDQFRATQEGEK